MLSIDVAQPAPTLVTVRARVVGATTEGVDRFIGVQFAAPPVGPLRWREPQAQHAWIGVLVVTTTSPLCLQDSATTS
ncbi:carboxylesterase family protein [Sphingomonas arantia]|uniref:Carboxylesterase family protein n=1 Tax=Sphingomonas arantia TaxID=1460676 RepID=A0ABW4U0J5_9SPHN